MKATISIIGWSVGQNKYKNTENDIIPHFSWEQAREMYEYGVFDIQIHTYDLHNANEEEYSNRRGILQNKYEMSGSYYKEFTEDTLKNHYLIENNVGNKVVNFTYPMGEYSFLSEQFLAELGYKVVFGKQKVQSSATILCIALPG
ncbi:polysaccharide deacetylase family protein [Brevibacillus sp. SIMBA_040]|uniref:polysaccharide deacetylase family protein n=1 Tax=unclassified Brevibacillus TaxID=2684853 RepID=UPI00397C2098